MKIVVMRAIAKEINSVYDVFCKVLDNPKNSDEARETALARLTAEITELHDHYFELRGHTGTAYFFKGVDDEPNAVKAIYGFAKDCEKRGFKHE